MTQTAEFPILRQADEVYTTERDRVTAAISGLDYHDSIAQIEELLRDARATYRTVSDAHYDDEHVAIDAQILAGAQLVAVKAARLIHAARSNSGEDAGLRYAAGVLRQCTYTDALRWAGGVQ